jgi:hypothetical protein
MGEFNLQQISSRVKVQMTEVPSLSAQVSLDDLGMIAYLIKGPLDNLLTVIQGNNPLAQALNDIHVMFDDEDGDSLLINFQDALDELNGFCWIHASRRLIKKEELRF